jgi:hypothetical protein
MLSFPIKRGSHETRNSYYHGSCAADLLSRQVASNLGETVMHVNATFEAEHSFTSAGDEMTDKVIAVSSYLSSTVRPLVRITLPDGSSHIVEPKVMIRCLNRATLEH